MTGNSVEIGGLKGHDVLKVTLYLDRWGRGVSGEGDGDVSEAVLYRVAGYSRNNYWTLNSRGEKIKRVKKVVLCLTGLSCPETAFFFS